MISRGGGILKGRRKAMLPNLLILGASKSGTTSLYKYLGQHPDIFMCPAKEPAFFAWEGRDYDTQGPDPGRTRDFIVTDLESYMELFREATNESIIAEGSTAYLPTPAAPRRIHRHVPQAKLIAILRNPIDRAYSAFLHARLEGYEPLADFSEALAAEPARIRDRWNGLTHYTDVGMYAQQLERYLALFPVGQLRVYLHDDLERDPILLIKDAFRFLDVEASLQPNVTARHNVGSGFRSTRVNALLNSRLARSIAKTLPARVRGSGYHFLRRRNRARAEPISPHAQEHLRSVFEDEVLRLSLMLRRDLSPWLEGRKVMGPGQGEAVGMQPSDVANR